MSNICLVLVVLFLYIILFLIYTIIVLHEKDSQMLKKIGFKFYIVSIAIALLSLGMCIFFIINYSGKVEYIATYFALIIMYMFFTNFYKSLKSIDKYTCEMLKRIGLVVSTVLILLALTYLLGYVMPIKDIVINRVLNIFLVCSLFYTIKSFSLLHSKNIKLTNMYFNNCTIIYLCICSIIYLCLYESKDIVGLILIALSIIIMFFDKVDNIMEYLNYDENKKEL